MDTNGRLPVSEDDVIAVDGRVDWLTVTAKGTDAREKMYQTMQSYRTTAGMNGETVNKWHFKGYAGLRMYGFRWGTRSDSDILMLSGGDADEMFSILAGEVENVTRLDLAVTCQLSTKHERIAQECYDWVMGNLPNSQLRKRKYTLYQNSAGGETLYVGSRASDQAGRLYDKAAEQGMTKQRGKLWRYEVEFKRPRAKHVYEALKHRWPEHGPTQLIIGTVYDWFNSRDVPPIFNRTADSISLEICAKLTSDAIKLAWLSEQVRPTVARLIKHGKIEQVFYALELMEPLPLNQRNL